MYDKNKDIVFNLEYTIVKFVKFMILQILFYIMRGFGVRLITKTDRKGGNSYRNGYLVMV